MINDKDILVKINRIKIDRLEHNRLECHNNKIKFIKEQNYNMADKMRDKERYLLNVIDKIKKQGLI